MSDKAKQLIEIEANAKEALTTLDGVKKSVTDLNEQVEKANNAWTTTGATMLKAGAAMTAVFTVPIVTFFTGAIKTAAEFEQAMAGVKAISGETGAAFAALEEQAKMLGATTRYTAVEAAGGMTMLARAGWDAQEILAGMPGMLDLAAAGSLDLARAADIISDVMMAFGENASEAGRYADVFAQAAANANTTVEMLGSAMAYAAPAAAAAGFSLEQTAAALSSLADAGIKGTRAGTTMDSVLRELRNKVEDGKLEFGEFSVAVYDSEGAMRDLFSILGDIETGMAGMTQEQRDAALGMVFTTRSLRGMNVWLTRGVDSLRDLEYALINSGGAAERMAETMMNTLQGAVIRMQSAMEGLKIAFGEAFLPYIKAVVDWVTNLVSALASLDQKTITIITMLAGVVAAIGPILVIGGTLVSLIGQVILFGPAIAALVAPFLGILVPIALVVAALGVMGAVWIDELARMELKQKNFEDYYVGSTRKISEAARLQNAGVLVEQAERHIEAIEAEIDHLIEMGHAVESSTDLQEAYAKLRLALAEQEKAWRLQQMLEERTHAKALAEAGADNIPAMVEAQQTYTKNLSENYKQRVIDQLLYLDSVYQFTDMEEEEWKERGEAIEAWGDNMQFAIKRSGDASYASQQAFFASLGWLYDYETQGLVEFGATRFGQIKNSMVKAMDDLPPALQDVAQRSVDGFMEAWEAGDHAAAEQYLVEMLHIMGAFGIDWQTGTKFIVDDTVALFEAGAKDFLDVWGDGIGDVTTVTEDKFNKAKDAVETILSGEFPPMIKLEAEKLMEQFGEGWEEATPDLLLKVNQLVKGIEGELALLDFSELGKAIPMGLGSGMTAKEALAFVETAAKEVAELPITVIEDILELESPSKVMIRLGQGIPEGLAEGILGGSSTIENAVSQMIAILIGNLSDIKNTITDLFVGIGAIMGNSLDEASIRIVSGAERIKGIYRELSNSIVNAISDLGGRLQPSWEAMLSHTTKIVSENISIIVAIFKELPREITAVFSDILNGVRRFGTDSYNQSRAAANQIINGFIYVLRNLPNQIWNIIIEIGRKLLQASSYLYNLARQAAQRLLDGFRMGLNMRSPSELERIMDQIVKRAKEMYPELLDAFSGLKNLERMMPDIAFEPKISPFVGGAIQSEGVRTDQLINKLGESIHNSLMIALAQQQRESGDIVIQIDGKEFIRVISPHQEQEKMRVVSKR